MAVEIITADLVSINGYVVELRDSRQPDMFDGLADEWNRELQAEYAQPIHDRDIDLQARWPFLVGVEPEAVTYQQIPRFIDLARQAAIERAVSYRGFKVGASAYAVSADNTRAAYLFGANNTPYKGAPRDCAEMDILKKMSDKRLDRLVALAIFGPADHGTVNAIETATLHPCESCRTLLDEAPAASGETLVITGNPEGAIELTFQKDLLTLHASQS